MFRTSSIKLPTKNTTLPNRTLNKGKNSIFFTKKTKLNFQLNSETSNVTIAKTDILRQTPHYILITEAVLENWDKKMLNKIMRIQSQ